MADPPWKRAFDREGGTILVVVMAVILTLLVLGSVFIRLMGSEATIRSEEHTSELQSH